MLILLSHSNNVNEVNARMAVLFNRCSTCIHHGIVIDCQIYPIVIYNPSALLVNNEGTAELVSIRYL